MLTLFLFISALSRPACAERPSPPRTGTLELGAAYSYFTTGANYDQDGNRVGIPNGGGLSTNSGTLTATYDLGRRWRALTSAEYAGTGSTDGYFDRKNGGISNATLGAQYFTVWNRLMLIPQVDAKISAYRVDENSDQAVIAEGVNTFRAGGWASYRLGTIQPYGYLGGEYRDAQRSSLVHYNLGAHARFDQLWVQAEVRGYLSLTDDSDAGLADRARRTAFLQRVNGASFRYYGVNPSLHEAAVEGGFIVNHFNLYVGASYTLAGSSQAQGWGAWGGVRFGWGVATRKVRENTAPTPDAGGFAPSQDPYDQTLFNDQPNVRRAQPLRPRTRPRPARPDPRLRQQDNLNRLLNETEQNLEAE